MRGEPDAADHAIASAVEQFQRAALDAVAAARAMLDAAESMIKEPAAIEAVASTVNAVARQATEALGGFARQARQAGSDAGGPDGDDDADDGYHGIEVQ